MHERSPMRVVRDGTPTGSPVAHAVGPDAIPFEPPMDTREIFRALIDAELRDGRLTPQRRRRIVQYAAQLRLSAIEVGRMIDECRQEVLAGDDEAARFHALHLLDAPPERVPFACKLWALAIIAILLDLLLIRRWF